MEGRKNIKINEYFQTEFDEFGVEYDKTNSILIYASECDFECIHYKVREGTIKICNRAFMDIDTLKSIELPDSLQIIESQAFQNCKLLESINFNNGLLMIDNYAFYRCDSLKSILLPTSLNTLGEGVFSSCSSMQSFKIEENNESLTFDSGIIYSKNKTIVIGAISTLINTNICLPEGVKQIYQNAFSECKSLISIKLPESIEFMGESAFEDCTSLQSINLPNNLKSIEKNCFTRSTITSISIPENVHYIGSMAFSACYALTAIKVAESNRYFTSKNGVLFSKNEIKLLNYPSGSKLLEYIIPKTVREIAKGAFESCLYLEKIELPSGLVEINENTFRSCRNLIRVNIPYGVREIGEYAFDSCCLLLDIQLPDSTIKIKRNAFETCVSLKSINIPPELTQIETDAFSLCDKLKVEVHPLNPRYKSFEGLLFEKCNFIYGLPEFYNYSNIPF